MADWIIDTASHARAFPKVQHRHPNGIVDAVRDRRAEPGPAGVSPSADRWAFVCPGCGDVYTWERRAGGDEADQR